MKVINPIHSGDYMMPKLFYMAHPVKPEAGESIHSNLLSALDYLAALLRAGVPVIAPWIGIIQALDDDDPRDRQIGMTVDLDAVGRCDGVIAVGRRVSSGMRAEMRAAHAWVDVTEMSPEGAACTAEAWVASLGAP